MAKPIYKPQKFYESDINDMVEDDVAKGGAGSGKRGHKTEVHLGWGGTKLTPESRRGNFESVKPKPYNRDAEKEKHVRAFEAKHAKKEDTRTESQKMADTRQGGPGFKRDWK